MTAASRISSRRTLAVLHPTFALTGVVHAVGGPLLPSLAAVLHFGDSQSGLLLFGYYAGTSIGALLCTRNYARSITIGLVALSAACLGVACAHATLLPPLFLALGISVGMPMSAVSMFVGRNFSAHSASPLTFLNFSWGAGALIAPLFAARLLIGHTYRAAYVVLAIASALAAIACGIQLEDTPETVRPHTAMERLTNLRFIAIFALLAFLEVGIENTAGSWLATYALRSSNAGPAAAAATSSLYWCGFVAARAAFALLLLRLDAMRVLRLAAPAAFVAAVLLITVPGIGERSAAMMILGAALSPIFPLLLALFFARARQSSDSRWILAFCGFGGSVLPWITGWLSARSGSLRLGLVTVPAALLFILCMTPVLAAQPSIATAE